jgi:hypothetical protein
LKRKISMILVLCLIFLLMLSTNAFAVSKYGSGTRTTSFTTSDYITFYPSYDYSWSETSIWALAYNKYDFYNHVNDGNFNQYYAYPFDQTMDNSTTFKTSPSGSEIGRINWYDWKVRSVILPVGDVYFPGYRDDLSFLVPIGGQVYIFWWWYLDEGWWGATKSVTHNASFTL